jgi:hypothetical protein
MCVEFGALIHSLLSTALDDNLSLSEYSDLFPPLPFSFFLFLCDDIFFLEPLAIVSVIHHAGSLPQPPRRLLIWTDNLDSVAVLNSLHTAEFLHNAPMLAIASLIL